MLLDLLNGCKTFSVTFFQDLIEELKKDSVKGLPGDGTVHELTSLTINSLKRYAVDEMDT